jgi:DNA-binding NarL/FixJ family response regulator
MTAAPHILIASDHQAVRHALALAVAQIYPPAIITDVATGAEALTTYVQHGADLLITEDHMPVTEHVGLIRALRAQQVTCAIVLVSFDHTLEATAKAAGASRFLPAPFELTELRQALAGLLSP